MIRTLSLAFTLVTLLIVTGCGTTDANDDTPLEAIRVTDIAADPTTGRDPNTGAPISSGRYTLYNLRDGEVVLTYSETSRSDSASTAWDIGFRGTSIIFNGGSNGPGDGGVVVVNDLFESVTEAPESGYDDALPDDNDWYSYNPATHIVTPVAGRTMVIRTADGRYAKLRILSYYEGAPAEPTADDASRYYTFEYVFQDNGSRDLSTQ
jgi:hypothetical protein